MKYITTWKYTIIRSVILVSAFASLGIAQDSQIDVITRKIEIWNDCHNQRSRTCFAGIYAPNVKIYGKTLSNADAVQLKVGLFDKYPDFKQTIDTSTVNILTQDNGTYVAEFTKIAEYGGKRKSYPSYLCFVNINDEYLVIDESDKVTDRNLARIKRKAATKTKLTSDTLANTEFSGTQSDISEIISRNKDAIYVTIILVLTLLLGKGIVFKKRQLKPITKSDQNGISPIRSSEYIAEPKVPRPTYRSEEIEYDSEPKYTERRTSRNTGSNDEENQDFRRKKIPETNKPDQNSQNRAPKETPKQEPIKIVPKRSIQYICSCCGHKSFSAAGGTCRYSASNTHTYIQENEAGKYICKFCGHKSFSATGGTCRYSPSTKHDYKNENPKEYICKFCGHKSFSATGGTCRKSGHGHHEYL